jgi:cellulose biosynthesis protein BcsQ/energy-coupling factor transporter ATP-binding protein EcfA2
MALANVADRLCRYGLKTLIVDFDLEAPGLERYFPIDMQAARQSPGLLDLLIAYKQAMSQPVGQSTRDFRKLEQYIFPVYYELPGSGSLHLLPAGMRGDEDQLSNYAYQLRTFDWQEFYFDWGGELFFQWLAREIGKRYDLALVDSRTGVTEMGGVCAYQLADSLVMFCAPNGQNLQGTRDVLRNFNSERVRALRKDRALQVLVAPARVQQDSPELGKFRAAFSAFEEFAPATLKAMGLSFWDLMVPYDPAFAFEERVVGENGTAADGDLPQAYVRLAAVVASMAGEGSKAAEAGKRMVAAVMAGTGMSPPVKPQYDATTSFAGYDVFISYQARDREFVQPLVNALQVSGLRVFFDRSRLAPGDSWDQQLDTAITQSAAVLVLVGLEMGPFQTREVITAIKKERRIIPVLLPQVSMDRVPAFLKEYHFIDLRAGFNDDTVRSFTDALTGAAKKTPRVAVAEEDAYVGLRSFDESDARFFFGREALVAQAVARLNSDPFLAIIGPSGSGKSALVRAGIVPRLRAEHDDIRVTLVRPFSNPVRELAERLAGIDGALAADQVERALREQAPIASLVKPGGRLVIVVDQLEELWVLADRNERVVYLRMLTSAARENSSTLALIVILRADFYGFATEDCEFSDLLSRNQLLVGRMTPEELRRAIEQPAQVNGVSFEPGLVERILNDLEESTSPLPLLQILLFRLWADRRRGFITHESYERCGGLKILSTIAEEAYGSLSPDEQTAARIVLLKMVSPQGARIAVPIDEFSPSERVAAEKLVQRRLLRGTQHNGSGFVELAYEPLIHEWGRLADWVGEERDALEFRDRLQHDIDASVRRGRILYRGETLSRAERWLRDHRELASAEQVGFVRASRRQLLIRRTAAAACVVLVFLGFFELMYSYRRNLLRVDYWLGQATVVNYLSSIQKGVIVDQRGSVLMLSGLTGTARPVASGVFTAVLSPDARTVAATSRRGSIDVIDAVSGATRLTLNPSGNPLSLAISGDGRELAPGTAEGAVHIWSLTDGRPLATAEPNAGPIQRLRFAGHDLLVNGNTEPLQVPRH